MKKHKLTDRQREVLEALAGNSDLRIVHWVVVKNWEFFSHNILFSSGGDLRAKTAQSLLTHGFLEAVSRNRFRISPKGREALNES